MKSPDLSLKFKLKLNPGFNFYSCVKFSYLVVFGILDKGSCNAITLPGIGLLNSNYQTVMDSLESLHTSHKQTALLSTYSTYIDQLTVKIIPLPPLRVDRNYRH